MNVYFLVEGKNTEMAVYPKWLDYLVPQLKRVDNFYEVTINNYCIFNCGGITSLEKVIPSSIIDINKNNNFNCFFDYFVICVDVENATIEQRVSKIDNIIQSGEPLNEKTKLIIIVQNRCIETWFLGNRKVFTKQPKNNPSFIKYSQLYNVAQNDPELMENLDTLDSSIANFHKRYLKAMLHERGNKKDSQFHQWNYLTELINRIKDTKHLKTFKNFYDFCTRLKTEIASIN